jgi:hypothetical protein
VLAIRVTSPGLGARGSGRRGGLHDGDFPRAVGRERGPEDEVKSSGGLRVWVCVVGLVGGCLGESELRVAAVMAAVAVTLAELRSFQET